MQDEVAMLLPVAQTAELRKAWPAIRDRIAALAVDRGQPWIAEDVFHELLRGDSYLWALDDYSGFLVLRIFASAYERCLHVWICCNDSEPTIRDYIEQLKSIALENGCSRITWESDRKYHRALPGLKVAYAYSIELGG